MTGRPSGGTDRRPPRTANDERSVLLGFLDHVRDAVAAKADGVPEPHVRAGGVPSGTSLLGLVTHGGRGAAGRPRCEGCSHT